MFLKGLHLHNWPGLAKYQHCAPIYGFTFGKVNITKYKGKLRSGFDKIKNSELYSGVL